MKTIAQLKSEMTALFHKACSGLGIKPLELVISYRSHATFATAGEANELAKTLRLAGETSVDVHHWDPKVDPDFTRDEYQVSWGDTAC